MAITRREFLASAAAGGGSPRLGPMASSIESRGPSFDDPMPTARASTAGKARSLPLNSICSWAFQPSLTMQRSSRFRPCTMRWSRPSSTFPQPHPPCRTPSRFSKSAIAGLEDSGLLDFRPSGLGLAVAWGLPYFNLLPSALTSEWLPIDLAASQANGATTYAILNASSFASDPPGVILEQNDIAFVMASDHLDHIASAYDAIFSGPPAELMTITSIRRGFVDGQKSAPTVRV